MPEFLIEWVNDLGGVTAVAIGIIICAIIALIATMGD